MDCPHCHAAQTTKLQRTTRLGYAVFRCQRCSRSFNKRTGTPFNFVAVPTDIVFQVLFHRVHYQLSYRDAAAIFLLHGLDFTCETVRDWEEWFSLMFSKPLRAKRREEAGHQWCIDETDMKVKGQWCYWYCAMDQEGNLVASRLSQTRAREAAKAFLAQTQDVAESPVLVMADGLHSYPSAIAEVLGPAVKHKPVSCTANRIEQDHRASSNAFR